jgi:hypothetical protein
MTYNVTRTQTHSKLPSGTFTLFSNNKKTKIPFDADALLLQQSIQNMDSTNTVYYYYQNYYYQYY